MRYADIMKRVGQESLRAATGGPRVTRRAFVKLTALSGLAVGFGPVLAADSDRTAAEAAFEGPQPSDFVHIAPDGTVTIQINRLEFGQGSHTGLARVLADELDADWSTVNAVLAKAGDAYKDPVFGIQMTGGSTAIANSFTQYRELGARARAMLVAAAVEAWGVDAAAIRTENGTLMGPGGQSAGYGELASAAMAMAVPEAVALKSPDAFRFIGQGVNRLDTEAKSTGNQSFGMDVTRPNMKTVLVARPPHFGGTVKSFDATATRAVAGVVDVLEVALDRNATGVAVVADGYWPAKTGRDALQVEWTAPSVLPDSDAMAAEFTALLGQPGLPARVADTSALGSAAKTITADFTFPFLAHTPMEPLNAVIEVADGQCDVWTGTQFQTFDQMTVAGVLGLTPDKVTIHTQFAGGGFGRRATPTSDYLADTARVMAAWQAAGHSEPLKLIWSREDDVKGGYYRPLTMHRAQIGLDDAGDIAAWKHTIASVSILKGTAFESFFVKDGVDASATEGVGDTAYDLPIALEVHHPDSPIPVLWWRSVGHTHSAFVMETLIDRVAAAAGSDPVELRRSLLAKHPRHLAALDMAVEKSGYGTRALPEGQAWGVAVHESFGSVVAHVVEASMADGRPKVHKVTSCIHCNTAVNPKSVEAQVQGSTLMGIGMLIDGAQITFKDGAVQQSNFHDYKVARMTDMPEIDVHIVPSQDPPTGVGEPGLPPIAPAVANAVFALTGTPVESLPMQPV
ncbi:MAG: xanthine dehydrogenase family protein molybdopterin-binding subunit [Pseudomonadota bacterium]